MNNVSLDRLNNSHAASLFRLIDENRPALQKFWWEKQTNHVNDSQTFITSVLAAEDDNGAVTRGVWVEERLVGVGTIHTPNLELGQAALGYWIDGVCQGEGYATKATQQLVEIAFNQCGLAELLIDVSVDNYGSRRVAENNGFTLTSIDDTAPWADGQSPVGVAHFRRRKTDDFVEVH